MAKCLEVSRRFLNTLPRCFACELPLVYRCFSATNKYECEGGMLLSDVVVEDSAKDELVQPVASLRELRREALRVARGELREVLRHERVKCVVT
jgi:hypothetical protein